ncbi:hypothetical protein BJV82DRAFT_608072 [Fennellomyces sp. T-0311]|nr:hypothetical protein BJV82DRAFT_608072 [Fennellomyces sp. T-0311]
MNTISSHGLPRNESWSSTSMCDHKKKRNYCLKSNQKSDAWVSLHYPSPACQSWRTLVLGCHETFREVILYESYYGAVRSNSRRFLSCPSIQGSVQELHLYMNHAKF